MCGYGVMKENKVLWAYLLLWSASPTLSVADGLA